MRREQHAACDSPLLFKILFSFDCAFIDVGLYTIAEKTERYFNHGG
jgi:hypothetical protein